MGMRGWARSRLGALFGLLPMTEPGLLTGGAPAADSLGRETLRLLTWNVHKNADPAWSRDFNRLLEEHRPDILHLQEARIDSMVSVLACRPEAWSWMASPNLSLPRAGSAVGAFTAARASLQDGIALLSGASEPFLASRKPMLRCGLPMRGSPAPLYCLNIHSLNFSLGLGPFGEQLDSLLGAAMAHRGPLLVSGDFNTWSGKRMDLLLRKMEAMGLRRVAFPESAPLPDLFSTQSLDHVFHSQGMRPVSARILRSITSSDHAPLLVEFEP